MVGWVGGYVRTYVCMPAYISIYMCVCIYLYMFPSFVMSTCDKVKR